MHFLTSPNPEMSAWRIIATVTKTSRSLIHRLLLPVVWERSALAPREGYCANNREAGNILFVSTLLAVTSCGGHV